MIFKTRDKTGSLIGADTWSVTETSTANNAVTVQLMWNCLELMLCLLETSGSRREEGQYLRGKRQMIANSKLCCFNMLV